MLVRRLMMFTIVKRNRPYLNLASWLNAVFGYEYLVESDESDLHGVVAWLFSRLVNVTGDLSR